ncbi:hypothetical protein PV10_08103 [Exophiala mesophila]|uniref:RGS domain-containing protein n=1 Tax=Exophiala mesophila TaxID=212818 RepID=A0A0D1Z0S8_EXOME|nr:uncharacterized protein PV10_08103 [Exophiala mesophila]KIV88417.1 hypothetical protein PV10_08103 [Exophiala mesophila]
MIKRKSNSISYPYTPEPSPPLGPSDQLLGQVPEHCIMASDDFPRARPISMVSRRDGVMSPARPTLEDVLNNNAPSPYTLAAYTAFLSQQHCLETLEFTTEAKKYTEKYDLASAQLAGMPLTVDTDEGFDLIQDWNRMLDIYVKPGAPREINLPAEERDELVECPYELRPPQPEVLEPAVRRMYDLMSDSIFIPFCNSLKVPYAKTYNPTSDWPTNDLEVSRLTFDERALHSRRRRSPPNTSAAPFEVPSRSPPQSHRPPQSSSLSSALGRQSQSRLSTHVSHSSAVSESALTDSSGGGPESPPEDLMTTPPTTPPAGDLPGGGNGHSHSNSIVASKSHRSESGGWKKMGMKIFGGGKKKTGSFNE